MKGKDVKVLFDIETTMHSDATKLRKNDLFEPSWLYGKLVSGRSNSKLGLFSLLRCLMIEAWVSGLV